MRDYVIMSDVNNDVTPEYAEKEGIAIFPQYYHFNDGIVYGDEIKLDIGTFFDRLRAGERAYSQGCNPQRVRGIMESALKEGHDILAIMCSSACSSSYNTAYTEARALLEKYPEAKIAVVDTLLETLPGGLLVRMAQEMKKSGKSFEETWNAVETTKGQMNLLFLVDDLKYLVRGGRLSPISGAVGTILNIKPILHMEKGLIASYVKCRGKQTGKRRILDLLGGMKLDKSMVGVVHTVDLPDAKEMALALKKELGIDALCIDEVNPTIGAHVGPGAFGVAFRELPK